MYIDYKLWPNTDGNLGNIKVQIPTGIGDDEWPEGDALIGNFVYKDGVLAGFVDTKALTVNDSKSTTINYDYFDIELPFTEGEISITRGERSKYFNVRYNPINDDNVVITLKYKGCKNVEDIKAVDPNYQTTDIVDGVWSEGLGDLEEGYYVEIYEGWIETEEIYYGMFQNCDNLTSFNSDLPKLKDGESMFWGCSNLTSFTFDLPSLTQAYGMFSSCPLTSFSSDLSNLEYGNSMFGDCTNLTTFTSDLPSLTEGGGMFQYCTSLTSFSINLPKLTNGTSMFYGCTNLESFTSDLSGLTNGSNMFGDCTNLTTFTSDLSSLDSGWYMFNGCTNLTTFSSDLSSMTDGYQMFAGCTSLTSFNSDLSSLTNGHGLFHMCKLDTASVQSIANTINTYNGRIHIGIGNSTPNEQEVAAFNTMVDKGWTVYVAVNGEFSSTQWTPTSLTPIDGEEQQTPIPFWAKPVLSDEEHAQYVDAQGNFYNILGGNYIYGVDLSTYGMFTCKEDAAANMRLTKIEKPLFSKFALKH